MRTFRFVKFPIFSCSHALCILIKIDKRSIYECLYDSPQARFHQVPIPAFGLVFPPTSISQCRTYVLSILYRNAMKTSTSKLKWALNVISFCCTGSRIPKVRSLQMPLPPRKRLRLGIFSRWSACRREGRFSFARMRYNLSAQVPPALTPPGVP